MQCDNLIQKHHMVRQFDMETLCSAAICVEPPFRGPLYLGRTLDISCSFCTTLASCWWWCSGTRCHPQTNTTQEALIWRQIMMSMGLGS